MLNELATKIHYQFFHKFTDNDIISSVNASQPIQCISTALRKQGETLDPIIADDPNWMVPLPIPSYGGK